MVKNADIHIRTNAELKTKIMTRLKDLDLYNGNLSLLTTELYKAWLRKTDKKKKESTDTVKEVLD